MAPPSKWDYWAEVGVPAEFSRMRREAKFTDVSIVCEDNVVLAAHRTVLECHSSLLHVVLATAGGTPSCPAHSFDSVLMLPDASATTVGHLLALLYTGRTTVTSALEVRNLRALCFQLQILVPDNVFKDSGVFKASGANTSLSRMARAIAQQSPASTPLPPLPPLVLRPVATPDAVKRKLGSPTIGGSEPKVIRIDPPGTKTLLRIEPPSSNTLLMCNECDKVFTLTIALQNHMRTHHQQASTAVNEHAYTLKADAVNNSSASTNLPEEEADPLSINGESQPDEQDEDPIPEQDVKRENEDDDDGDGFDPTAFMQQEMTDDDSARLNYSSYSNGGSVLSCPTCDREYSRNKIREHIVTCHHIPTLRRLYVSADGQCAFCPKKGLANQIARHVGLFHNKIEELGTPAELAVLPTRRPGTTNSSFAIILD